MKRLAWGLGPIGVCLVLHPATLRAQDIEATEVTDAGTEAAPADASAPVASEKSETIKALVRGVFVEARVGGGYMVVTAPIGFHESYPNLDPDTSEGLGTGSTIQIAAGYDLNDRVSLQVVAGAVLAASRRRAEPVRDLSLLFGGAGARIAIQVAHRVDLVTSIGLGYANSDNAVENAKGGAAVFGGVGVEYYVHVRHFSVGVDISVLVPFSPFRLWIAATPQIKYTF